MQTGHGWNSYYIKLIGYPCTIIYFQLDKGISSLAPMFLDAVICEGIDYSMMTQLESCQLYTTTTTTTDRYASQHTSAAPTVDMISNSLVIIMGLTKWL